MQHHTEIHLLPGTLGRLPRLAGVNVELQGHAAQSNLWDWLADSGFQALRQFHPELNLRRHPAQPGTWGEIRTEADYETRRDLCRAQPELAFRAEDYAFTDDIPWLGVPDEILAHSNAAGLSSVVSVGAYPRMFERCLLPDLRLGTESAADAALDWEAAACLHEYAFALIWHCASEFGVRDFTTINEPENQLMCWFYPESLQWVTEPGGDHWFRLFRDDRQPTGEGVALLELIADQYAATARVVRDALEDVQTVLREKDSGLRLRLHGPTNVVWKGMWVFSFPSTHRNYKHLVYGDMNLLDWSGRDLKPWDSSFAGHPDFEEQQLRFATPAYHMIRMINRALRSPNPDAPEAVWISHGLNNPTSAGPDDLYFFLKIHALRRDGELVVFILNDSRENAEAVYLNLSSLDEPPECFVARISDRAETDALRDFGTVPSGLLSVGSIPAQSMLAVHLGPDPLKGLREIQIVEETLTPGSLLNGGELNRWQTTRLAVKGVDASGRTRRIPDEFLTWESSSPRALRVDGGGLVQRVRHGAGPVTLTVTTADGRLSAALTVPDGSESAGPSGPRRHLGSAGLAEV